MTASTVVPPTVTWTEVPPIEVRILAGGGLLAQLRMVLPEAFAYMRKFEPGVNGDGPLVASRDQPLEIGVALRIRFVIVPGRNVESADAGFTPAVGEVVQIDAQAI